MYFNHLDHNKQLLKIQLQSLIIKNLLKCLFPEILRTKRLNIFLPLIAFLWTFLDLLGFIKNLRAVWDKSHGIEGEVESFQNNFSLFPSPKNLRKLFRNFCVCKNDNCGSVSSTIIRRVTLSLTKKSYKNKPTKPTIGWSRGNRSVCIFDFSQFNFKLFSPIFYQKIQHEILYKNKLKCSFSNVPMKYGAKDMMKFQYVQLSNRKQSFQCFTSLNFYTED